MHRTIKHIRVLVRQAHDQFISNYEKRRNRLYEHGVFGYLVNSSGYVLVIVLIITTLLVSVAGEFIAVSQTNINYMRKFQDSTKACFLARSGIELAKYILLADDKGLSAEMITGRATDKSIDSYNDVWAIEFPPVSIDDEGNTVTIRISDENSKINLSVLSNEVFLDEHTPFYGILQHFFMNMGMSMEYADIMTDWVDIDDSRYPYGAESSDYYQALDPPYNAKNAEMDSISEVLMMKDITPEIYYGLQTDVGGIEENLVDHNKGDVSLDIEKLLELTGGEHGQEEMNEDDLKGSIGKETSRRLSDYLRVHGKRSEYNDNLNKININTASYRVLSALTDNMTDDIVSDVISRRLVSPFTSVDDISDVIEDETIRRNLLSVKSFIFKITSVAECNNAEVTITAYYNRQSKKILYWCEY